MDTFSAMSTFEEDLRASLSHLYDLERELTGAGMSRVFVAIDRALARRIVIKVLPPELTAGVNRERFRREVQVAAALQHPHIVTLLSAGEDGDLLYYTMPYIEGESLRTALETNGALPVRDVVRILHDVVDALAYAHARGVIHRDIKPGNILKLGAHAMVTDFGVAKALNAAMPSSGITSAGMAIGTPAYMAPEQLAGDPASDHRIDIYAVGLLAYELLTGESPFTGPSPQATMAAQLTRDPEPLYKCRPEVPPELSAIIMQCLAKTPDARPATAEALMAALDAVTTSSGEMKTGGTPVLPAVGARRRRLARLGVVTTLVLGSAVALYASLGTESRQVPRPKADAVAAAIVGPPPPPRPSPVAPAAPTVMSAPRPIVLTREDSFAIAAAVRKRLAQEEASKGARQVAVMSDSITAMVRKVFIDSIVKHHIPAMLPMPPDLPVPPAAWGKRRVVITEPRETKRGDLKALSQALIDSLRRSLSKRGGYLLVDQDSVRAVLQQSRSLSVVADALRPDLLISPAFLGAGDSLTLMVTIRDLTNPTGAGLRMPTSKIRVGDPGSLATGIQLVLRNIDDLARTPRRIPGFRTAPRPGTKASGIRER